MNDVRASERIPCAVPITISGRDAFGREFMELSHTKVISSHGALIVTSFKLALGSSIRIMNRSLSRWAVARVIRLADGRSPRSLYEAGVELGEGAYLWPLDSPVGVAQESASLRTNGDRTGTPAALAAGRADKPQGEARGAVFEPSSPRMQHLRCKAGEVARRLGHGLGDFAAIDPESRYPVEKSSCLRCGASAFIDPTPGYWPAQMEGAALRFRCSVR
jgi:hypothetical protein